MDLPVSNQLIAILSSCIAPNGRIIDSLYGATQASLRVTIMRLATGNPKHSKSQSGVNKVLEALFDLSRANATHSIAGKEAHLVKWIQSQSSVESH